MKKRDSSQFEDSPEKKMKTDQDTDCTNHSDIDFNPKSVADQFIEEVLDAVLLNGDQSALEYDDEMDKKGPIKLIKIKEHEEFKENADIISEEKVSSSPKIEPTSIFLFGNGMFMDQGSREEDSDGDGEVDDDLDPLNSSLINESIVQIDGEDAVMSGEEMPEKEGLLGFSKSNTGEEDSSDAEMSKDLQEKRDEEKQNLERVLLEIEEEEQKRDEGKVNLVSESSDDEPPWFLDSETESKGCDDKVQTDAHKEESNQGISESTPTKTCDIRLQRASLTPEQKKYLTPEKPSLPEPECFDLDSDDDDDSNEVTDQQLEDVAVDPENDVQPLSVDEDEECPQCGLTGARITMFTPGSGLGQAEAMRDPRVSAAVAGARELSFRARNVLIYCKHGHMAPVDKVCLNFCLFFLLLFCNPFYSGLDRARC